MIAYLDASVVLRLILGEPDRLAEWKRIETAVASALTEVECLRTLDRLLFVTSPLGARFSSKRILRNGSASMCLKSSTPIQAPSFAPNLRYLTEQPIW